MKKVFFVSIVVCANVLFIILNIHQYSQVIKLTYEKQKNELLKNNLVQKKQSLTHHFYALQNRSEIKKFVSTELNMEPLTLKQIKKLNANDKTL